MNLKLREYELKAPRLGAAVYAIRTLMLLCASTSTLLGAFQQAQ